MSALPLDVEPPVFHIGAPCRHPLGLVLITLEPPGGDAVSTFVWIDHSEKQRRQMMEAIDAFREKDTRDELGLAGIRDTFSDLLFPGTAAAQSRARYFFFVPWMYRAFEEKRYPGGELERRGKVFELALIDQLAKASDHEGTIGIRARGGLQRLPSNIYWNGLRTFGMLQFPGTQWEFHRTVDRRRAEASGARTNDDGEPVSGGVRAWHAGIPPAPRAFQDSADFRLSVLEARYLRGRILETQRPSLFAFLLDGPSRDENVDFAWEHSIATRLTNPLERQLRHARCFSEMFHGAAILYNLLLADIAPQRPVVHEKLEPMWAEWVALIEQERTRLSEWDRRDFWTLLAASAYVPSDRTREFVDAWAELVLNGPAERLRTDATTRDLIFTREKRIKGALARCASDRAREKWSGDAGLGRMDFRWSNARVLLRDIVAGLEDARA